MAKREVDVCAKCGKDIEPKPDLGHHQGGLIRLQLPALTWEFTWCEQCLAPIFGLIEPWVERTIPDGTVPGVDKLAYLPRADEPGGSRVTTLFSEE